MVLVKKFSLLVAFVAVSALVVSTTNVLAASVKQNRSPKPNKPNEYGKYKLDQCPVCLNEWKEVNCGSNVKLSCDHHLCASCLHSWEFQNDTCPCCRKTMAVNEYISIDADDGSRLQQLGFSQVTYSYFMWKKNEILKQMKFSSDDTRGQLEKDFYNVVKPDQQILIFGLDTDYGFNIQEKLIDLMLYRQLLLQFYSSQQNDNVERACQEYRPVLEQMDLPRVIIKTVYELLSELTGHRRRSVNLSGAGDIDRYFNQVNYTLTDVFSTLYQVLNPAIHDDQEEQMDQLQQAIDTQSQNPNDPYYQDHLRQQRQQEKAFLKLVLRAENDDLLVLDEDYNYLVPMGDDGEVQLDFTKAWDKFIV